MVSAAPELDINKACGECKQRAEEVAMGVRGLRRTSTVGAVGDKNNKRNGRPQAEVRTRRLLAFYGDASLEQMSGQKGTASGREAQSVGHQWWAGGKEQRMFQREAG